MSNVFQRTSVLNISMYLYFFPGGIMNVEITSALLRSVRNARAKYQEYLEKQKTVKEQDAKTAVKRKRDEELKQLREKRSRLDVDALSMDKEADKLLELAEKRSQLTLLAKANALRRGAKTKRDDIVKLDAEIVAAKKPAD